MKKKKDIPGWKVLLITLSSCGISFFWVLLLMGTLERFFPDPSIIDYIFQVPLAMSSFIGIFCISAYLFYMALEGKWG